MEDFPRRNQLDKCVPAELAIFNAIEAVEKSGADLRLTSAVMKLQEAKEFVSDFVDGVEPKKPNFLERLKIEKTELEERLNRLNDFNQSEKVNEIDPIQKSLLLVQAGAMYTYLEVLRARLERL